MTRRHLIVGAGAVGTAIATLLADRGEQVTIVSRRGRGLARPSVEARSADASDAEALTSLAQGSAVVDNCLNLAYHRWPPTGRRWRAPCSEPPSAMAPCSPPCPTFTRTAG